MIAPASPEEIARAAERLRSGGLVAFPTETVYGLGALVFDAHAVARIFAVKRRPFFDPLIVHVADAAMLARVSEPLSPVARRLVERFWPGPLTLVLPKRSEVPQIVTAGLPTVAARMPAHPVARALLEATGAPLAAPSANAFGRLSPTRAAHVAGMLGDRVDLILDGGSTPLGIESTIVALEPRPALLRAGAVPVEEIEAVVGPLERPPAGAPVRAPGQLLAHYAPLTPLRVIDPATVPPAQRRNAGALSLSQSFAGYAVSRRLTADGDLASAAAAFFDALHELDAVGLERIDAQPLPERGLGIAMMDRLRRAAAKRSGSP